MVLTFSACAAVAPVSARIRPMMTEHLVFNFLLSLLSISALPPYGVMTLATERTSHLSLACTCQRYHLRCIHRAVVDQHLTIMRVSVGRCECDQCFAALPGRQRLDALALHCEW